ncbi:MAG: ABC transporter permease [Desulfobacterota bacterium]|nr:ABC transporter permease [Thermodesulfobacteriota bacterium]MDW8001726.1 ABC transporter permease [Deltaproteobacteria bacterium]
MLKLKEYLRETFKILYFYKLRVLFSFSGVALGILSISIIVTTIEGANKKAKDIFESLGPDSIMVFSGSERQRQARIRVNTLTHDDAEAIGRIAGIYHIVKVLGVRAQTVKHKDKKWQTLVVGATPNYFSSFSWNFRMGGPFDDEDEKKSEAVCVLGWKVYRELFEMEDPVGKWIIIGRLPVKVIGVLEERGGTVGGPHIDDRIILPLSTVMERLSNERKYLSFIRLKTLRDPEETMEDIKKVLRRNHGILEGQEDDFTIRSAKDIYDFVSVISGSLFLFLGTASCIALIVSGFVLANLFYLTIDERRKDIGIRRTYGASRRGILISFLFESITITLIGGIVGVSLSFLLGGTFERFFNIPMVFTHKVILFAVLFSFLTGLISGIRPAMKASRIEPIEAIRS